MPHKGTLPILEYATRFPNASKTEIMRKTGELFILRTNINSVGSVLDSPVRLLHVSRALTLTEVFPFCWVGGVLGMHCFHLPSLFSAGINGQGQTYPDLQPLYEAARSYLEVPQRIDLLNTRVEVCGALSLNTSDAATLDIWSKHRSFKICYSSSRSRSRAGMQNASSRLSLR